MKLLQGSRYGQVDRLEFLIVRIVKYFPKVFFKSLLRDNAFR